MVDILINVDLQFSYLDMREGVINHGQSADGGYVILTPCTTPQLAYRLDWNRATCCL